MSSNGISTLSRPSLPCIGLTGGIAAGKTTVSRILREEAGLPVEDLDAIGRELLFGDGDAPKRLRHAVAKAAGVPLKANGELDRRAIREVIFANDDRRRALEAVLHPVIWNAFLERVEQHRARGAKRVVCEAALLCETGLDALCDELWVVSAPASVRLDRLVRRDGIPKALAEAMLRAQWSDEKRTQRASHVLPNATQEDLEQMPAKVRELVARWSAVPPPVEDAPPSEPAEDPGGERSDDQ
jgi:dephospho-CoA kinase